MVDAFNMTVLAPAGAIVSASNQIAAPDNVLTAQPGERAAATGTSAALILDLGSVQLVRQIAILYHDLLDTETFGCVASATQSEPATDPSPALSVQITSWASASASNVPAGYRHALLHLDVPVSARWVRLTIPNGRSVGRIVVGNPLQVEYNPDYGSTSWGYEEAPEPDTLDSGVTVLEELAPAPYFEFSISWSSEAEMETAWQFLARRQWTREPVLVVRRPDSYAYRHSGIFYGVLRLQPFVAAQFDTFEVNGKIRSMV